MLEFGALGYLATSLLYALFTLLMLVAWLRRRGGGLLVLASFFSAVWALALSASSVGVPIRAEVVFSLEMIRSGTWIAFLAVLLGRVGGPRWIRLAAVVLTPAVLLGGLLLPPGGIQSNSGPAVFFGLVMALSGLLLIEQVYRNSPENSRWGLKPLVLALGSMFAFDLFLYSQAVLFSVIDPATWLARGAVNVLFVPLIAVATRRNPTWDLDIFVSRQIVFYTTTLVAVGIYLVGMSLGGYLLIQFGGSWGSVARIVFFAGACLVLVSLLFSDTLRGRLRVFLNKHFFRNKYDYREEWLRLVETLANLDEASSRENTIRSLAQIVNSPGGVLWVLDDEDASYRQTASVGDFSVPVKLDDADPVIRFIKREAWLIDLKEFERKPDVYNQLQLPDWLVSAESAWLIVPLVLQNQLFGLVLLNEAPHSPRLNFEDRDLLKTVGSHVAVHLAQEKAEEELSEAQQFEAYNRLTAFLMHDLNNLIAQQSLIVKNAEKHKRNPDFVDDAIGTISNSVARMKKVMAQLRSADTDSLKSVRSIKNLASAAVDRCSAGSPVPVFEGNDVEVSVSVNPEQFIAVVGHLIKNSQDATVEDGVITVGLSLAEDRVAVRITDTGEGMSEEFIRDRLFKPFDSTKGVRGMGIGAYQAREFARSNGGELNVTSAPGKGTSVSLWLPQVSA